MREHKNPEVYLAARFWAKVDVRRPGECWPWKAASNEHGYGLIRVNGSIMKAHRLALELSDGVHRTSAEKVRHNCDNPPCCNPAHLSAGSQAENVADMVSRGRQRGIEHSILSASDRSEMLAALGEGESQAAVARRFGISPSYVSMIAAGKRLRGKEVA